MKLQLLSFGACYFFPAFEIILSVFHRNILDVQMRAQMSFAFHVFLKSNRRCTESMRLYVLEICCSLPDA